MDITSDPDVKKAIGQGVEKFGRPDVVVNNAGYSLGGSNLTGQSKQQHIHNHLIEKAKEILMTTRLSVSEVAYQFGFEYPQFFSKFFKNKTNLTPLEYRHSINNKMTVSTSKNYFLSISKILYL